MHPARQPHVARFAAFLFGLTLACGNPGGPGDAAPGHLELRFGHVPPTMYAKVPAGFFAILFRVTADSEYVDESWSDLATVSFVDNPAGTNFRGADTGRINRGIVFFPSLAIGAPGDGFRLRVTSGTLSGDSPPFNVLPTPLSHLGQVTMPVVITAGVTVAPAVRVAAFDLAGDTATGFTGAITLDIVANPSGDSLRGTTTQMAIAGVATFPDLVMTRADSNYLLRARATGLGDSLSRLFRVVGGAPVRLSFLSQPEGIYGNMPFAPPVQVGPLDSFGNLTSIGAGVIRVDLAGGPAGAALRGTLQRSGTGRVTFPGLTVTLPGAGYRLVATRAGLPPDTSLLFTMAGHTFSQLAAGQGHTCGVDPIFCWGDGSQGQLHDSLSGIGHSSFVPQYAYMYTARAIGSSAGVSCALFTLIGCWGHGITGPGTLDIQVGGGFSGFDSLSVGQGYACGLLPGGSARCFTQAASGFVTTTEVNPGLPFRSIAVGAGFMCGLTSDSLAHCVGTLDAPGLAPTPITYPTPTPVPGTRRFAQLFAGGGTICGLAADGSAWCWGENGSGQYGNGGTVSDSVPQLAAGGMQVAHLAVGGGRNGGTMAGTVCGRVQSGQLYCWGDNTGGVLGNGGLTSSLDPVAVAGGHTFTSVTLTGGPEAHACALETDGTAWCWGSNASGQLGNGTAVPSAIPVKVP